MNPRSHYGRFGFIVKNLLEKLSIDERNIYCLVRGLGDIVKDTSLSLSSQRQTVEILKSLTIDIIIVILKLQEY